MAGPAVSLLLLGGVAAWAAACSPTGKDRCVNQVDCLPAFNCHPDGRCRLQPASSHNVGTSSSSSGSSSSAAPCPGALHNCQDACVSCPAGATQTQCAGAQCQATGCASSGSLMDGTCLRMDTLQAVSWATQLMNETMTAAAFPDGLEAVAYARGADINHRSVRMATSRVQESGPFQEELTVCNPALGVGPCSAPAMMNCGGVRTVAYLDRGSNPTSHRLRLAQAGGLAGLSTTCWAPWTLLHPFLPPAPLWTACTWS